MRVGEKQKTLLRWEAVVAAFLMLLSMMLVVMPGLKAHAVSYVDASSHGVSVEFNPSKLKPGSSFTANVTFDGSMVFPSESKVTITGYNGISGSYKEKVSTSLYVPKGKLTYDGVVEGDNPPMLEIKVDGNAYVYQYTLSTSQFEYDQPVTPTPSGNLEIADYTVSPSKLYYGQEASITVTVKNTGDAAVSGVSVKLGGLSTGGLTMASGEKDTDSVSTILAGGSYTFRFRVKADEKIATSTQILTATATCGSMSDSVNMYIDTIAKDETASSEPSAPELIGNQITVSKNAFMPEIKAGETKEIQIPLNASAVVGTAQVTLTMPDGLYLESASATQSVNFRKGASSISCKVTAKKDVTDSVASIGIKSVYQYDSKQVQEDTTFSVRLRASQVSESTGKLVITEYKLGASNLSYNGNTDLTVTVQNTGTAAMKEITMTLDGMATGSVTLKSGMDVQTLKELLPGQTSTFTYQLHADETVSTGTAILTATAACGENTSVAKIFVPCTGKPEDKGGSGEEGPGSSKPQIIIESYTYGDGVTSVTGGSTFTLTMTLRNTSASTAIQNIKMVVSSAADDQTGGAFTPASSSNSFYIASVGAGETFTESIDLIARADASPKSYGISVELSYDAIVDKKMENLTSTETITIPVTQPDRFEVDDVQIDSMPYVGDSIYCSVSYVNKGKSTIYNLSIAVEGTGFTTADTNTYIGNVEAGSGDSFSPTLNTSEAGPVEGKIIFTYEDASGNQSTIEKPFSTTVQEMDWGDDSGDMTPDEPVDTNTGLPLWGKIAIIAGCVIAAGVIVVVVIKIRKKKKKPASPYDDYDDGDDSDYDDQYNDGDDE